MPSPGHEQLRRRTSRGMRVTIQTVILSTLLALVKIVSGVAGRSNALIADGVESISDIFGSLVVLGGLHIASIPPDREHPYGHGKAESMAAAVVALGLLVVGIGLGAHSVGEIIEPQRSPAAFTLIVLAVVVVTKEWLYRRLARVGRDTGSSSLQVDAWHQRSDALTSAAAFVGIAVAVIGGPRYASADDWAALVACGVIVYNGARLLRSAVGEVMDAAAPVELERSIRSLAIAVPGVVDIEKCLARKSGPGWLVDIHVEVDGTIPVAEGHAIGHRVKHALCSSELGILDVLVHIEPARPPISPSPHS